MSTLSSNQTSVERGARCPRGDERAALEGLYRAHVTAIHARCRKLLGDRASAEDATHETFLRVSRYLRAGIAAEQLPLLIHRIATNLCLKQIRKRNARARLREWCSMPDLAHSDDALLDSFHVLHTLQRLPEQTQRIAWLMALGHTQSEVAESLCISRRTVVYRLSELRGPHDRRARQAPPLTSQDWPAESLG